jgi:capsular polysaccharide biosynthesis protein
MIHVVLTVARQIEGEIVMVRAEKAFRDPAKAASLAKELREKFADKDGRQKPITVNTQEGQSVDCYCEAGIFDIELED